MFAQLLSFVLLLPSLVTAQAPTPAFPDRNNPPRFSNVTLPQPTGPPPIGKCKNVQARNVRGDQEKAEAIKDAFRYGYNAYVKYAFGYDELMPLSANGTNDYYGWGLTIIDSIDTAIIMGLEDVVKQMLDFISKVDFSLPKTDEPVQVFETNIRYLGGLISAYDLLKSGQFPGSYDTQQIEVLLKQATILIDKLAYGFNTPTGLPAVYVNFTTNTPVPDTYVDPVTNQTYNSTDSASSGSYLLEFWRMSDLTGNATYRRLAERANSYLIHPDPKPVYPGLIGTQFDIDTGKMLTFDGGWAAGVDSFLEYLIKSVQYNPQSNTTQAYRAFWLTAVQSTMNHIALHPYGFPHLTFLSRLTTNGTVEQLMDDFSCFAGGNFLLGGALLDLPRISALGIDVTHGCHQTYNTTATGLGPLAWGWFNEADQAYIRYYENDAAKRKSAQRRGFYTPPRLENWFSRPEPVESLWYAHRITGEARWAAYAWEVFQAVEATAKTEIAFAAVNDVDIRDGGSMSNNLDSFFFAEVLKYLYLTFTEPDVVDLSEWVFNTEAHPFRALCAAGSS
ncbi:glycoside hydrolase family 47 [Lecanosticta acicola]|uniref:alpha-1,2-Mannosidase n=1 Tax=Lecanosticta acicola TaxID=111012 RepID=A0AAI8W118_9PEZI|nr:glycoside hydrolase family 47 [Lecanosticta acicola]